ncbi:MAG: hypothetical protein A2X08_03540 [Bacteroidetes bacterium GWA2_32_17]|nr:MAG: hypothetical protein A2X08_03540 [Bacteroidetes bacterium GWA2_32_17]
MKYQLIIILIFSVFLNSFSQNYLSIKPNAVSYFYATGDISVSPIRIDSIKTHSDSTDYYSFCMIRPINNESFTTKGASWIGKKMVDCGNGMNLFFNKEIDTIFIKTNAQFNESWIMFTFLNGNYVEATISAFTNETFIGISDSIKTISLQVKDNGGSNISNLLNSITLKLSKNYGFSKIINFYEFPFDASPTGYYPTSNELEIIGISNPITGWQNITLSDVYSMNVGDEIQLLRNYYLPLPPSNYTIVNEKTINKYLTRTENFLHDTVTFSIDRCFWRKQQYYPSTPQFITNHDTLTEKYPLKGEFDKLPLEPIFDGSFYGFYNKIDSNGVQPDIIFHGINDTLSPVLVEGWNYIYFNYNLGTTYTNYGFYGDQDILSYNFYNVNGTIWGTPYICDSLLVDTLLNVGLTIFETGINIYPNPANNLIYIDINDKSTSDFNIQIYDMQGRLLLTNQITESNEQIDISIIPQGIYLTKITNQKTSSNYKLIISR